MSYSAALHRVRVEFTRAAAASDEHPPVDLVARAKAKLEAVKGTGEIATYFIFESRLQESWRAMRALEDAADDRKVILTLGAGAPQLPGVTIEKSTAEKTIATLGIEAPRETVAQWRWEWFKIWVLRKLRDAGIKELPNFAQVFAAFARARAGETVQGFPVGSLAALAQTGQATRAFSVVASKQRMEIGVVIRNVGELVATDSREAMLALIGQAVRQLSSENVEYTILKKDFLAGLQSAIDGQESLGIDLPVVLLAGMGTQRKAKRVAAPTNYPGVGKISFEVTRDKMEALITGFHLEYYDDPSFQVSTEWIQLELRRLDFKVPMAADIAKGLSDLIVRKQDLNGILAARGTAAAGGKSPYLHASFRDAAARGAGDLEGAQLDIREMQQRAAVQAGQLIAEIRFEKPPVKGTNVYGEVLPPAADDMLDMRIGEGVQLREGGKFYATADGLPMLEDGSISLSKVFVHEGDVNLRSGNIHFDGPVEIKGSIDSGAIVETTGDLVVHGTVRSTQVRVGGNLTAHAGITTGLDGRIRVRGNVFAEFIENSSLVCGGDLIVAKVMVNANAIVGGKLVMKGKGLLAGGSISTRGSIVASSIGFKNGAVTVFNVGVDWRIAQKVEIRTKRLENLQKKLDADRQAFREITHKQKAQLTQRHKELKEELAERLTRWRALIATCEAQIAEANAQLSYNLDARITVAEQIEANVQITIGGQKVPVTAALASVAILSKRQRGSFVVALEELEDGGGSSAA